MLRTPRTINLRRTEQHLRDAHKRRARLRFYSTQNLLQSIPGAAAVLHRPRARFRRQRSDQLAPNDLGAVAIRFIEKGF
jgi:hypothetical protein